MSETTPPITIKKYANRRLYNTASSSYVTLEHLCQMVKNNQDFVVYDAKTGEDITRSVLTQIIVEEEGKDGQQHLLPISFLRQLISFYGDSLGGVIPRYLEFSMQAFQRNESQLRQYMHQALGGLFPFNPLEEVNKQNMTLFENAMKMFVPFYQAESRGEGKGAVAPAGETKSDTATVADLQTRLNSLQSQIDELSKKK